MPPSLPCCLPMLPHSHSVPQKACYLLLLFHLTTQAPPSVLWLDCSHIHDWYTGGVRERTSMVSLFGDILLLPLKLPRPSAQRWAPPQYSLVSCYLSPCPAQSSGTFSSSRFPLILQLNLPSYSFLTLSFPCSRNFSQVPISHTKQVSPSLTYMTELSIGSMRRVKENETAQSYAP